MLRPFLLSLVLSGLGAVGAGADGAAPEMSTWRWSVSAILDAQRASAPSVGAVNTETFGQRYERYSALGLPEGPVEAGRR